MSFVQEEFEFLFNDRVRKFLDGIRAAATWRTKQSVAWWTTERDRSLRTADLPEILLPGEDLNNQLRTNVPFSICHGDSHAANIICTAANQPLLIDYAATGPGPRALDFVVFEASLRVIEADSIDIEACARRIIGEQSLWEEVWRPDVMDAETAATIVQSRSVFWERLSATVVCSFRRYFPDARPEEYARVAILQGVRLSPVWWVDDSKSNAKRRKNCVRVRLATWMSPMVDALHRAAMAARA